MELIKFDFLRTRKHNIVQEGVVLLLSCADIRKIFNKLASKVSLSTYIGTASRTPGVSFTMIRTQEST